MPLEGHWQRRHTPLRAVPRRERRILAALLGLLVAAAVAVVLAAAHGSRSTAPGCIDAIVPSTTGAGSIHVCGSAAARLCSGEDRVPAGALAEVRAACRRRAATASPGGAATRPPGS